MIERRAFPDLGHAAYDWLDTHHHFSFDTYYDPRRIHWGTLRVWNDDEIASGTGFPPHPHADMEIITYVREGVLTHRDSLGNEGHTEAGNVQVMHAGTGIRHAEYNLGPVTAKIFQIWILPKAKGGTPGWGNKPFPKADRTGRFVTLASGFPEDTEALPIRTDARVMGATLLEGESISYTTDPARHLYLVPSTGELEIGGQIIHARDGAAIHDEANLEIKALADSEIVVVETV